MANTAHLNGFTGYKNVTTRLMSDLKQLQGYSEQLHLQENAKAIDGTLNNLANESFSIAVIGEFNRGKSTIINALMGSDILPMDILPTTATLNRITYSVDPYINVQYKDGREERIGIEQLQSYVTKLTKESAEKAQTIQEATIYYPINYCKNGVTIVDTPGLNDDAAMTEVTLNVLSRVDAAVMVIMADAPFSDSERDFLENRVITADLGKVLFVVTGIDKVEEDGDEDRVLNHIRLNIEEKILKKAKDVHGEGSEEYNAYVRKIGQVRVHGVSAKRALRAKKNGDQALLERSRLPAFEAALEKFLSEDRAAIMLNMPVTRVKRASVEIVKAAQLRETALAMEADDFARRYNLAMEEIAEIRDKRRAEITKIEDAAGRTIEALQPQIQSYWSTLRGAAMEAVDAYPLEGKDLSKANMQDTCDKMNGAIQRVMQYKSQTMTEQMQGEIMKALEKEAERLSDFEVSFFAATERIQQLFVPEVQTQAQGSEVVAGTVINYFTLGFGSAYLGYKNAGWKGALLGGVVGGISTFAGSFAAGILIGVLGIAASFPVLVIGGALGALAGVFAGDKITKWLMPDSRIDRFKASYKQKLGEEIDKIREEDDIALKIREQVDGLFEALEDKVRSETDAILNDTQTQLTQLKVEAGKGEETLKREKDAIVRMLAQVDEMCVYAGEVEAELTAILSREEA